MERPWKGHGVAVKTSRGGCEEKSWREHEHNNGRAFCNVIK